MLSAYGARRPTQDVDASAIGAQVAVTHLTDVVRDIAAVQADDGVMFDLDSISARTIRPDAEYPAFRLEVKVTVGPYKGVAKWDVSTGDPIVPDPREVHIDRILGDPITILGYPPETTIAEKGVTILERGIESTRWRDYIDIVQLCQGGFDSNELLNAARAVAQYRGVVLESITPHVAGYGEKSQTKWAAWRKKHGLEAVSAPDLDAQLKQVAFFLNPVFILGPAEPNEL